MPDIEQLSINSDAGAKDASYTLMFDDHEPSHESTSKVTRMNKCQAITHVLHTTGSFTATNAISAAYIIGNGVIFSKLGANAVAAGPFMATIACAMFSVSRGGINPLSNIVGRLVGELKVTPGNEAEIGAHSRRSWVITLGLSGISYAVFLNVERILRSIGVEVGVAQAAQAYFSGISYGLVPSLLNYCDQQLVLGLNQQRVIFISGLTYPLIAAAIGYPLALGAFNLPKYGIAAIGWGGSISGFLSFIALRLYLNREVYKQYRLYAWDGILDLKQYRSFLKISIPYAGLNLAEWGNLLGLTLLVGPNSTVLAATQATLNPLSAITSLIMGLTQATGVSVSTCLGEGKRLMEQGNTEAALIAFDNAKTLGYAALGLGIVASSTAALVFTTLARQIASVFIDPSQDNSNEIINMAVPFLIITGIGLLPDTIRNVAGGALRGYGDVRYVPIVSIIMMSLIGLTIGGVLTRSLDKDTNWLFITRVISITIAAGMILHRFINRSPDVLQPAAPTAARPSYCQRLGFFIGIKEPANEESANDTLLVESCNVPHRLSHG